MKRSAMNSPRRSRQSPIGSIPVPAHASCPSTDHAGRGAVRGWAEVGTGCTRSGSAPARANTSRARSHQVGAPLLVAWYVPLEAPDEAKARASRGQAHVLAQHDVTRLLDDVDVLYRERMTARAVAV